MRRFLTTGSLHRSRGPSELEDELFRQASNLSANTDTEVAIFTIRSDGQTRAYGCPSVDAVLSRYLAQRQLPTQAARFKVAVDELLRCHIERKREEEREAMERETASGRELKEMEWSLEFLEAVRARVLRKLHEGPVARSPGPSTSGGSIE